jgi:hypothetical protein
MTPFRIEGFPKPPLQGGVDLSANQHRFVKAGPVEGQAAPIVAVGDRPVAVQADKPRAGLAGDFVAFGIVELVAGAAIAYGTDITTDAQGRAVPLAAGSYACGWAMTAAAGAGEHFSAFINLVAPHKA